MLQTPHLDDNEKLFWIDKFILLNENKHKWILPNNVYKQVLLNPNTFKQYSFKKIKNMFKTMAKVCEPSYQTLQTLIRLNLFIIISSIEHHLKLYPVKLQFKSCLCLNNQNIPKELIFIILDYIDI